MAAPQNVCSSCATSGHKHILGAPCPTCGHNEQQRAFEVVQHRGPTPSSLHFEAFDTGTCDAAAFNAAFAFAKIMRERIFVADLNLVKTSQEFDDVDSSSRHIYGFIGDAPVAYMRWRVLRESATVQYVIMERILVLKTHRQRGIGRQLVAFALQDIVQKNAQLRLNINAIMVHVPEVPYILHMFQTFGFKPNSAVFVERGRRHARMALTVQVVTQNTHHLAEMHTKAPTFNSGTGVTDRPAYTAAAAPAPAPAAGGVDMTA